MLPFPQIIGWTISFKQSRKERSVNICKHRGSFLEARDSAGLSHGEGVDKQEGITPSTVLSASNSRDVTGLAIEETHGGNTDHGYCLKKLTAESQTLWLNLHWRSPGRPPGGQLRKLKARRPPAPSAPSAVTFKGLKESFVENVKFPEASRKGHRVGGSPPTRPRLPRPAPAPEAPAAASRRSTVKLSHL